MKKISNKNITKINNGEFLPRQISESVRILVQNDYFIPAFSLMACSIDALTAMGNKQKYISSLESNFPELCKKLGAIVFYEKYRNGLAHLLAPLNGYGIDRNSHMKGEYLEQSEIIETKQIVTSLNIDRFYKDFEVFLSNLPK